MALIPYKFKRKLSEIYLDRSLSYVKRSLDDVATKRSFDRICIVAALDDRNGITRGARLQFEALRRLGYNVDLLDASAGRHNPFFRIKHNPASAYIFHSGGPQLATLLTSVLPAVKDAYRIAYWAWELPTPPKLWPDPQRVIAEIWTCSTFSKKSLAQAFDLPIHVVPHAVPLEEELLKSERSHFTVLILADSRSSFERKNPIAGIDAFNRAFKGEAKANLIVKVSGDSSYIRNYVSENCPSLLVTIIDSFLDEEAMKRLFRSASILLSLHRAEGFGLPLLEAMAAGVPVIATDWSGNLDFMNYQNSILIDADQIQVRDRIYSRYADCTWAEPHIPQAAEALECIFKDSSLYERLSTAGRQTAESLFMNWRLPTLAN